MRKQLKKTTFKTSVFIAVFLMVLPLFAPLTSEQQGVLDVYEKDLREKTRAGDDNSAARLIALKIVQNDKFWTVGNDFAFFDGNQLLQGMVAYHAVSNLGYKIDWRVASGHDDTDMLPRLNPRNLQRCLQTLNEWLNSAEPQGTQKKLFLDNNSVLAEALQVFANDDLIRPKVFDNLDPGAFKRDVLHRKLYCQDARAELLDPSANATKKQAATCKLLWHTLFPQVRQKDAEAYAKHLFRLDLAGLDELIFMYEDGRDKKIADIKTSVQKLLKKRRAELANLDDKELQKEFNALLGRLSAEKKYLSEDIVGSDILPFDVPADESSKTDPKLQDPNSESSTLPTPSNLTDTLIKIGVVVVGLALTAGGIGFWLRKTGRWAKIKIWFKKRFAMRVKPRATKVVK